MVVRIDAQQIGILAGGVAGVVLGHNGPFLIIHVGQILFSQGDHGTDADVVIVVTDAAVLDLAVGKGGRLLTAAFGNLERARHGAGLLTGGISTPVTVSGGAAKCSTN